MIINKIIIIFSSSSSSVPEDCFFVWSSFSFFFVCLFVCQFLSSSSCFVCQHFFPSQSENTVTKTGRKKIRVDLSIESKEFSFFLFFVHLNFIQYCFWFSDIAFLFFLFLFDIVFLPTLYQQKLFCSLDRWLAAFLILLLRKTFLAFNITHTYFGYSACCLLFVSCSLVGECWSSAAAAAVMY